uniref:Uncharacterized protein n=1 Tax=Myotis myotis TaxID=51298 RepID=A0A7J7U535_MYOMY|nr:hypothetical protein mMyoMyo1_008839 [Myotis myotis]
MAHILHFFLPGSQPSFPAGPSAHHALTQPLCTPRPCLSFPSVTHFLLSGAGHRGPIAGKAVVTLSFRLVTCLLFPCPSRSSSSSLWTGGPCLTHLSLQGLAPCRAQRSHSVNGWSSSDITTLAPQPIFKKSQTDVRLLVFLVLWDYSQDDTVSAINFHIDLSSCCRSSDTPLPPTPYQGVFCSFRKSAPPKGDMLLFLSTQEARRPMEMQAIPVSKHSEPIFLATLSPRALGCQPLPTNLEKGICSWAVPGASR